MSSYFHYIYRERIIVRLIVVSLNGKYGKEFYIQKMKKWASNKEKNKKPFIQEFIVIISTGKKQKKEYKKWLLYIISTAEE